MRESHLIKYANDRGETWYNNFFIFIDQTESCDAQVSIIDSLYISIHIVLRVFQLKCL